MHTHTHTHTYTHTHICDVINSELPVAEKPVRLMGDDESHHVKGALFVF